MIDVPNPYPNGTHLIVNSVELVVTNHHPHAEAWRYEGHPAALSGSVVHFSHHEAQPVPPRGMAAVAAVLAHGELDDDLTIMQDESPEGNVIQALAMWAHGRLASADLRATYMIYAEGSAL